MFVSLLQLMGLAPGKPLQSRAEEKSPVRQSADPVSRTARGSRQGRPESATPAEAVHGERAAGSPRAPARRQDVKAQAGKTQGKAATGTPAAKTARVAAKAPVSGAAPAAAAAKAAPPGTASPVQASSSGKAAAAAKAPAAKGSKSPEAAKATPAPVAPQTAAPERVPAGAATTPKPLPFPRPEAVAHTHIAPPKDPKLANNWKTKPVEAWTDAEVLAMPDSEYMNDKQMAFFRLKLVKLKQDILANAGETTEHLREDTVIVPDPADRATIEEEHALELRTRDRERKLLKKIEQSIARIDAGDYGYCDETGEPIGVGRLLARPTATLSLEAQQRRELKQKMFGD